MSTIGTISSPVQRLQPTQAPRPAAGPGTLRSVLALARPRQWSKNVLLLAAPAAAGVIDQPAALARGLGAVVVFVLLSVSVYALNDVRDAPDDRRHPVKCHRPVASGALGRLPASAVAVLSATAGLAGAAALGPWMLAASAAYLTVSLLYVLGLKHVAVVDLVAVAVGFVLRAVAGAAATHVPVSSWFLLVSLFGALFLVAAKRRAELANITTQARTRPVLAAYSTSWLDQLVTIALLGATLSYGLWAFQYIGPDVFRPLLAVSVVPLLTGLLRYSLLVSTGRGETPEREVFGDRVLLLAGVSWLTLVGSGLYLA